MSVWPWNLVDEMERMHRDIELLLGGARPEGRRMPFSRVSFLPGRAARAYPLINISDDGQAVCIDALAPGVNPDTLNVSITGRQLTITGEKDAVNGGDIAPEAFHRKERAAGRFLRTVALDTDVDGGKITADYANGLLRVVLPKAESAKKRQIQVNVR